MLAKRPELLHYCEKRTTVEAFCEAWASHSRFTSLALWWIWPLMVECLFLLPACNSIEHHTLNLCLLMLWHWKQFLLGVLTFSTVPCAEMGTADLGYGFRSGELSILNLICAWYDEAQGMGQNAFGTWYWPATTWDQASAVEWSVSKHSPAISFGISLQFATTLWFDI